MKKHNVLFFGPYPEPTTGQSVSFKESSDNYEGNKIIVDTTKFKNNKLLNTLYCLSIVPFLFVFKKFTVVYFTCTRSTLGALKDLQLLILCKMFNKKVVNHLHGADFKIFYNNLGKFKSVIKYCYNKIDVSIVLLPSMKEQFSDFTNMKIEVVENCYATELDCHKVDFEAKKKQVLYLSNLIYSKGIFVFMEAAQELLKEDLDIIIKIAGVPIADDFMSEKETYVKFHHLFNDLKNKYPERIFYLGGIQSVEKVKILLESSIFVLPTFYKTEAFPITIIEAMRFGNAIITTSHNYLTDIINENNGGLIKINSSLELIDKVRALFLKPNDLVKIQQYNMEESMLKYNPVNYNLAISRVVNTF